MKTAHAVSLAAAASAALGCGTLAAQEQPALITQPTDQSRAELQRVLSAAFNGQSVAIADDALTRDSVLIIDRREPRDSQGRPLSGRVVAMPERFRLVLSASQCELVRESDGRRWVLAGADCVPNPNLAGQ